MSYQHGVYVEEQSTSITAPVTSDSAVQVVIGTAPVNMSQEGDLLAPKIAYTYDEAKKKVGYSNNFADFTLCEAINASFLKYSVAPVVFINVLDPTKHIKQVTAEETVALAQKQATISKEGILPGSLVVKSGTGETEVSYVSGKDYALSFDDNGYLTIRPADGGAIAANVTELKVTYSQLDPSKVTKDDIIAGIQKIGMVYPLFNVFPGLILAPKWSADTDVYMALAAKTEGLNGLFRCFLISDMDTVTANSYEKVAAYKSQNSLTNKSSLLLWPKCKVSGSVFDYSAIAAAHIASTDADNEGVPYVSPSNKALKIEGICDSTGKEITLDFLAANELNGAGVCTALNMNGWRFWGNRTAAYPANTDVKDSFIPVRRMFSWWGNTFILTYFQKVDDPTNKRLIESVVDSENIRAGGFKAKFQIADAKIAYNSADNTTTDLLNGKIRFKQNLTPFPPAEAIINTLEFDTNAFKNALS
jgi:phage tail sheath protein FI